MAAKREVQEEQIQSQRVEVAGQPPGRLQDAARPLARVQLHPRVVLWGCCPLAWPGCGGMGSGRPSHHSPTQAVPSSLGSKPRLQRLLLRQRYPP